MRVSLHCYGSDNALTMVRSKLHDRHPSQSRSCLSDPEIHEAMSADGWGSLRPVPAPVVQSGLESWRCRGTVADNPETPGFETSVFEMMIVISWEVDTVIQ